MLKQWTCRLQSLQITKQSTCHSISLKSPQGGPGFGKFNNTLLDDKGYVKVFERYTRKKKVKENGYLGKC